MFRFLAGLLIPPLLGVTGYIALVFANQFVVDVRPYNMIWVSSALLIFIYGTLAASLLALALKMGLSFLGTASLSRWKRLIFLAELLIGSWCFYFLARAVFFDGLRSSLVLEIFSIAIAVIGRLWANQFRWIVRL